MTAARTALLLAGMAVAGYGAVLLWEHPPVVILRIAVWALAGVVLHDLVFAPLCVALGFAGRRLLPRRWWAPVALAAFGSVVLVLLAVPVYGRPGARPDNPTVLDRNYPLGLWISVAALWVCALAYVALARWSPVRQDRMVQHQRTGDVDGQPPTG